ncbi:MAG TPA: peptidylprolyl isomerase [Planctomycetota bacterium]|nr:peptidylprolyl isomerase [Planctomycetota bacterium]
MAFGGRTSLKEPIPEETGELSLLDRVNAFGERHARAIIIVSTALIIVTVLIFAQVLWSRTLFDRVERDLTQATSLESLEALRKRYAGSAAEPRILATLGHRYASDAKLAEAKAVYAEFLSKHSGHVLASGVNRSLAQVEENLRFLESRKAGVAGERQLSTHPLHLKDLDPKSNPVKFGPTKQKDPRGVMRFKGMPEEVRLELYEDEAPNAVASFVSLAEQKYFEGLSFTRVGDERLRITAKEENPATQELAFEPTSRSGEIGSLALVRRGAHNASAEFEILLKPVRDAKEITIFGRISMEGSSPVHGLMHRLEEKDLIESVKIDFKRDHEYKPAYAK